MAKEKQDKPMTKEELGLMLHKYINPVYEDVKSLKKEMTNLQNKVDQVERIQLRMENDINEVKLIQLRMENRLVDDNKLLHDRDDDHDKKIRDHEKRVTSLEGNL